MRMSDAAKETIAETQMNYRNYSIPFKGNTFVIFKIAV